MFCPSCGAQNPAGTQFCSTCGKALPGATTSAAGILSTPNALPTTEQLASIGSRIGAWFIDVLLSLLIIPVFINMYMGRRGSSIGLKTVGARIIRVNGDVSGFFHTYVRQLAAGLSSIPLGLGYFWALWDPKKQTWHDKILSTYVLKDTSELATRKRTSATAAVIIFWIYIGLTIVLLLFILAAIASVIAFYSGSSY